MMSHSPIYLNTQRSRVVAGAPSFQNIRKHIILTMSRVVIALFLFVGETHSQTLLQSGVVTRETVQEFADVALDITQIRAYGNDAQHIQALYEDGMNVELNGRRVSLRMMMEELVDGSHVQTPNSMFFDYGVHSAFQQNIPNFASETVLNVIKGPTPELSADAVLALVVWHIAADLLWTGVRTCQRKAQADDQAFITESTGLDEFIALWLGQENAGPESTLYDWAEDAERAVDPERSRPEAQANTNIKLLYQQGAALMAVHNACTKQNEQSVKALWNVAVRITSEMMIPLVQWFLFALESENTNLAKLYATALVPHLSRCQPSLFKRASEALTLDVSVVDKRRMILDVHEAALRCFGITCQQLNTGIAGLECNDQPLRMAGYKMKSTHDASLSRIDMDIHALEVFAKNEFSQFVYKFGWNVPLHRGSDNDPFALASLSTMATRAARSVAARTFLAYFGINDYAEKHFIFPIYDGTSKWRSEKQQEVALALTAAYHIVYLEAMRHLDDVVADCVNPVDLSVNGNALDRVAVLLTGSYEGQSLGGSKDFDDGRLLWHLGNRRSFQFQTMTQWNYGVVNQDILDLLYAARGEQDAAVCSRLQKTVNKLLNLTQIAMLQNVVGAAIENEQLAYDSESTTLVDGEVLALSVVPFVDQNHAASVAQSIRENMEISAGVKPVRDGYKEIQRLVTEYIEQNLELPACRYLGRASSNDCSHYGPSPLTIHPRSAAASMSLAFVVLWGASLLFS